MTTSEVKRESRKFWINDEGVLKRVKGYSCAPTNPDYWWFPELGYSSCSGKDTKEDAKNDAIELCKIEISNWSNKLKNLEKR